MEELAIRDRILLPLHRDGYPFVLASGVITVVLGLIQPLFWLPGLATTLLLLFAFRMPHSVAPTCARAVLSPASGTVLSVEQIPAQQQKGNLPFQARDVFLVRISTTTLDAAVLRFPVAGRLVKRTDHRGSPAGMNLPKARTQGARIELSIEDEEHNPCFVRIFAGALGRHISLDLRGSETVPRATACGLLRFGGCVEVLLDAETIEPYCSVGMRCYAGETILARFAESTANASAQAKPSKARATRSTKSNKSKS